MSVLDRASAGAGRRPAATRGLRRGLVRRRGWLVRRMLAAADVVGLALAFLLAEALVTSGDPASDGLDTSFEMLLFLLSLPGWVFMAKLYGLYDRDEERTDHSTVDDAVGVFHLVTVGAWLFYAGATLTEVAAPEIEKVLAFWALAVGSVTAARAAARGLSRRHPAYLQRTVILGAGDIGQLVARKLEHHPEYGIDLVGFVDANPRKRREDLRQLPLLGGPEELPAIIARHRIERVIVAFSRASHEEALHLVRALRDQDVQIDVVPRLFEIVGPNVGIHTIEGLPLISLPPAGLSRSSRLVKRVLDVVGATFLLVVSAPLFAFVAAWIKLDSPGPVFFRQTRLGMNMRGFTMLKFRTMRTDADEDVHRRYIESTMDADAVPAPNGVYKLERAHEVTQVGRWLRRSLDELPQLVNVLRGEMSLVGPRPCVPYETEFFKPHHFDRFLVPAGLTGLWQVTARAHSTFGEALDLDVAYVHGWSLGLDLRILFRTPVQLLRPKGTR